MSLTIEQQLIALALVLYLSDSLVFLTRRQGVLISRNNKRWQASLGTRDFLLAGRSLYLCNPLTPGNPVFRLTWAPDQSRNLGEHTDWHLISKSLADVGRWGLLAGIALYVVLPMGLLAGLWSPLTPIGLALLYASLVVAIIRLVGHRKALGLTRGRLTALAFEALACPPFGVNLARRIAMAIPIPEQLPDVAELLLTRSDWMRLAGLCANSLDEELVGLEPDSEEFGRLTEQRDRFVKVHAAHE